MVCRDSKVHYTASSLFSFFFFFLLTLFLSNCWIEFGDMFVTQNHREDGFLVVYIPLVSEAKFKFLAQFPVDHYH